MTGRLITVVGPSGAGKDTLLDAACAVTPSLVRVQRVITRPASAGGEPFHSVEPAAFMRMRDAGAFVFWWEAHGLFYGIPAEALQQAKSGQTVVFNGSRAALTAMQAQVPWLEIVAITAPAEVLARRLAARGRETEDDIRKRLERAAWPVPKGAAVVVNDSSVTAGTERLLRVLNPSAESCG